MSGAESYLQREHFCGSTEALLLIKPFVSTMTRSELMAVMTGGNGRGYGAQVVFFREVFPTLQAPSHASIISAPAALAIAKAIVPETEVSKTAGVVTVEFEKNAKISWKRLRMGPRRE